MYLVVRNEELIFGIESCINNHVGLPFMVYSLQLVSDELKRLPFFVNSTANSKLQTLNFEKCRKRIS